MGIEDFFKRALIAGVILTSAPKDKLDTAISTDQLMENQKHLADSTETYLNSNLKEVYRTNLQNVNYLKYDSINENIKSRDKIDSVLEIKTDWLKNYINSDKYKEILKRELINVGQTNNELIEKEVNQIITYRTERLNDSTKAVDTIAYTGGSEPLGVTYTSDQNRVEVSKRLFKYDGTNTATHEKAHQSTKGNIVLIDKTEEEIRKRVNVDPKGYYNNPTEVHARLVVLKNLLDENNIYDPKKEDFTLEHFQAMTKNVEIMTCLDVKDLFFSAKTIKDLIWLMNNVA